MNHTQFPDEIYELYVLGALEPEERAQIDAHLAEGCEHCLAKLQEANRLAAAMTGITEQVKPPQQLRARVLASVTPAKRRSNLVYLFVGLAAACLAMIVLAIWTGREAADEREEIAQIRAERNDLRSALELMSRPETRAVQFGNIQNAPHGRVFVSGNGRVVFVGTGLPTLPSGKSYELWIIPTKGAPQPAGVFQPDSQGGVLDIAKANGNIQDAAAVAVSIEPLQGSMSPTSTPFLVVKLT